jgi:hypothetical protein
MASGIYLSQLHVSADAGEQSVVSFKIAVVR